MNGRLRVILVLPRQLIILRKFLIVIVLLPVLGAFAWWYFRERPFPDYGPAYREYAYITNGKSNTVSVIDLRTFELAKTIAVGISPTGIAANARKNEIYVVNTGSNNVSVIDAEKTPWSPQSVCTENLTSSMSPKTAGEVTLPTQLRPMSRSSIWKNAPFSETCGSAHRPDWRAFRSTVRP